MEPRIDKTAVSREVWVSPYAEEEEKLEKEFEEMDRYLAKRFPNGIAGIRFGKAAANEDVIAVPNPDSPVVRYGVAQGWPTRIKFDLIAQRVKRHHEELSALVSDPTLSKYYRDWMREWKAERKGRIVSALDLRWTSKGSTSGYYGPKAETYFLLALEDLGPFMVRPSPTTTASLSPMLPGEFLLQVLLPEAVALLICEDLNISCEDAYVVLRDSRQFGVEVRPLQEE